MNPRLPPLAASALSLALCAIATGLCALLDPHLYVAGLTLIYLLAVVVAAAERPHQQLAQPQRVGGSAFTRFAG